MFLSRFCSLKPEGFVQRRHSAPLWGILAEYLVPRSAGFGDFQEIGVMGGGPEPPMCGLCSAECCPAPKPQGRGWHRAAPGHQKITHLEVVSSGVRAQGRYLGARGRGMGLQMTPQPSRGE